jgi:hypothetical protein
MDVASRGGDSRSAVQPGPVYDTALRRLAELDPAALCRSLLGIEVTEQPRILSAQLPAATLSADLLLQLDSGALVHMEYMRATTTELVARMLIYRGLIMRAYPGFRLVQGVLVLGAGRVAGFDDLAGSGFALDLRVVYMRTMDPGRFLGVPSLAPLAVLGRGSVRERAGVFAAAVRVIREQGGSRVQELMQFADRLATITLDRSTIEAIVKEAGMSLESLESIERDFGPTEYVRGLRREAHSEGRSEGRDEGRNEGRNEGREQARVELLTALLRERFGDRADVSALARRLAGWPEVATAVHAVSAASSLDDLLDSLPAD